MRLAALLLLSAVAFGQQSYRVRLFSVQQPAKTTVAGLRTDSQWRICGSCEWKSLSSPIVLSAETSQVRTAEGTSPVINLRGGIRVTVAGSAPVELDYPLTISAARARLKIIAAIPAEDYVQSVMAGEASASDPPEYLKAMAVAIRSYARHFPELHKLDGFQFCDTTHCQNAQLGTVDPRFRTAVEATSGEILWYQGSAAATNYHRHCGGKIAAARDVWSDKASSYLSSHDDPYCLVVSQDNWQATISKQDLIHALEASSIQVPPLNQLSLRVVKRSSADRVQLLEMSGRALSASSLRFAIGRALGWNQLRSDWYEIQDRGSHFLFTGRGHGHGVGLCQIGAIQMAKQGKSYRDILSFYYSGTSLGQSAQGIEWHSFKKGSIEVLTTEARPDSALLELAASIEAEMRAWKGLRFVDNLQLKVFPTTEQFRDATGEPGWVAASTRSRVIRLQPLNVLRTRRILESTLRHEMTHVVLEANTTAALPLWFKEGLVLHLCGERSVAGGHFATEQLEQVLRERRDQQQVAAAYAQSKQRVDALVEKHGRENVLGFLRTGLPAGDR